MPSHRIEDEGPRKLGITERLENLVDRGDGAKA
jgi:hypothetical protein